MTMHRPGEPSFAGVATFMKLPLVLDPGALDGVDVAVVGAPVDDLVTYRPGARFGPREIRAASDDSRPSAWSLALGVDPFADLHAVDHGDIEVVPMDGRGNLERIRVGVEAIASRNTIPVVLGGDHSISYATVAAVAAHHAGLHVVHFDTHADTAEQNYDEKHAHGTPFRWLVEEGHIEGGNLVQVGLRGHWPEAAEFSWMRAQGIRWHRIDDVHERGIDAVMHQVLEAIAGDAPVFLSVDIDVLDPAFAPGTGTPEPGGMSTRELLRALRTVAVHRAVVGMDVVEVSPPYDTAGITAMAAHRCVLEVLSGIAARRGGGVRPENP